MAQELSIPDTARQILWVGNSIWVSTKREYSVVDVEVPICVLWFCYISSRFFSLALNYFISVLRILNLYSIFFMCSQTGNIGELMACGTRGNPIMVQLPGGDILLTRDSAFCSSVYGSIMFILALRFLFHSCRTCCPYAQFHCSVGRYRMYLFASGWSSR